MITFSEYAENKKNLIENFNDEEVKSYILSSGDQRLSSLVIITRLFNLVGNKKISSDQAVRIADQLGLINSMRRF
jgi:hypothetical protein